MSVSMDNTDIGTSKATSDVLVEVNELFSDATQPASDSSHEANSKEIPGQSILDDASVNRDLPTKPKMRRVEWGDDVVLSTQGEVDEMAKDGGFVKYSTNFGDAGETIYYRCKTVSKAKAKECVQMKVFKSNRNTKFIATTSVGEHKHSPNERQQKSDELWEYIYNLKFEDGMKPRRIKQHLARNKPEYDTLTIRQIRHILTSMEKSKIPSTFSFGELVEWLKLQTNIPTSCDDAFVVDWCFNKDDKSFAFVVSTPRLLKNTSGQSNLSADGTYKIIWQGFPLIVVGTLDREKHFHVTAIVVTSNERETEYEFVFKTIKMGIERETGQIFMPKVILSDYAGAIRNGFFKVFGPTQNVICCVHLYRKLRERSGFSNRENKQRVKNDVFVLQSAPDAETFDYAVSLFLEKWQETEEDFCHYFKSTWLGETTRNWFAGYSPFVPDHNNGVEGTNLSIKRDFTLRERLPLNTFKVTVMNMVHQMSLRYDPAQGEKPKEIVMAPQITNKMYREAYTWYSNNPCVAEIDKKDEFIIYLATNDRVKETLSRDELINLKNEKYDSFDDFKVNYEKVYNIRFCIDKKRWLIDSTCSCRTFQKEFLCKHLIGLAFYNQLKKCPEEGNNAIISKKPKKGRIALAKSALIRQ